jgi:hypothetical protein
LKCPVCKQDTGTFIWPTVQPGGGLDEISHPLYQVSYKGQKEYREPRCEACLIKMLEREEAKKK